MKLRDIIYWIDFDHTAGTRRGNDDVVLGSPAQYTFNIHPTARNYASLGHTYSLFTLRSSRVPRFHTSSEHSEVCILANMGKFGVSVLTSTHY